MRLIDLKNIQFNELIAQFGEFLASASGPNRTINKSSVFGQLLTVIAGVVNNILLYIEDALTEQNKYTAQRKKSIYGLAAISGYKPSYGRAAGVWVRLAHKPNNEVPSSIIITDKTRMACTQNGLFYCLDLGVPALTVRTDIGLENTYLYAVQGNYESQRFSADGGNWYTLNMNYIGYIDTEYVIVYVNGERWTKVESIYDAGPMERVYTINYNPISGIDIMFGNDIHGAAARVDDAIEVRYLIHDGESGNIEPDSNTQFVFGGELKSVNGEPVDPNAVFEVKLATMDAIASGSYSEDLQTVKRMIGFNSRALVLADSNNYKAFINRFSFCGYNRTWSEPGSLVVNSLIMQNYKLKMKEGKDYFNLTDGDFVLSEIQKQSIKHAIDVSGMQLAGTTYNIIDMDIMKYAIYIYVKLKDSTDDKTRISNSIKNVVGDFFGNIQSDDYIPKSDIIMAIKDNVPEVDGVDVYLLSQRNEQAIIDGYYEDKKYIYDPSAGTFTTESKTVYLGKDENGNIENPNIGFDAYGNILIDEDNQFPVLMGGWKWQKDASTQVTANPITIMYV